MRRCHALVELSARQTAQSGSDGQSEQARAPSGPDPRSRAAPRGRAPGCPKGSNRVVRTLVRGQPPDEEERRRRFLLDMHDVGRLISSVGDDRDVLEPEALEIGPGRIGNRSDRNVPIRREKHALEPTSEDASGPGNSESQTSSASWWKTARVGGSREPQSGVRKGIVFTLSTITS